MDGLMRERRIARNAVWNLVGLAVPLVVALWAIPVLINGMGTERFGLLSIIWMGVGYFSLFDLGLGRALTKIVAERLASPEQADLHTMVGTALTLMLGLGLSGAFVVALLVPWITSSVLTIPGSLFTEAATSFWILAATLPFVISTTGLIGILQAHQKFPEIAVVRVPLGVMNFLGPALMLAWTPSLVAAAGIVALSRVAAWVAYWHLCRKHNIAQLTRIDRSCTRELLSFGGWITVSSVVGPLMVYFDRFIVGSILTMTAVAYYVTPYEVVTRLWLLPDAIVGAVFPALTAALVSDRVYAGAMVRKTAWVLTLVTVPPIALCILFADELLTLWLGSEFAVEAAPVLRWLAIGVFVNALSRLFSSILHGIGRPDLTARLHLVELPLYISILWVLTDRFGILGAAVAWTTRIILDNLALFCLSMFRASSLRGALLAVEISVVLATAGLFAMTVRMPLAVKIAVFVTLAGFAGTLFAREVQHLRSTSRRASRAEDCGVAKW